METLPAAVVFDLYDTLVIVDPAARRAHQRQVARQLGIELDEFRAAWDATALESSTGVIGPTADRYLRVARQLGEEGLTLAGAPEALADDLAEREHSFLRAQTRAVVGVPDLLRALRAAGVRTWLLSNCSRSVEHTLAASGLLDLLDGTSLSCEVGAAKPDLALYAHALDAMAVPAGSCVYVADGLVDEHAAAQRAGMRPVRVTWSHDDGSAPEGTPVVATTAALADVLGIVL
jgi:putative hydrolase of the HAD superfamily